MNDDRTPYDALGVLFAKILEPVALYRALFDERGEFRDVVYIDVNPAYEQVMGIRKEDILGRPFREIWSEREREWQDIILQVATTGIYARYEGPSYDTGKYLHAIAFSPTRSVVAVIFIDMTDWKRAEEALQEKEALLTEYRQELRTLAARLSLAEERTRREIAVKLHDRVGYSLVSLLSRLRALSERHDPDDISPAIEEVEELLSDTRSLTLEISSPLLYEVGLEPALASLAERMLAPHGIAVDFRECGPEAHISMEIRILMYQMAQELLLNVIKHARAKNVILRVQRGSKRVRLLVEDDGAGFSANTPKHWGKWGGMGLFSIREKLHSVGGEIRVFSEKGKGSTVALVAPLAFEGGKTS
jgi:PAS domain S-box-containing protein